MDTDVLVIGAGINGLLTALHLARAGMQVTVVDMGDLSRESSWAGAGILAPLLPWQYGEEVNAMTERGRSLWPELASMLHQATGIDPEYWPCGMLATGDFPSDLANSWCASHGWKTSLVGSEVGDDRTLWLPGVAQVRNPRVTKALSTACVLAGIRLQAFTEVRLFELDRNRIRSVSTSRDTIRAGFYVVAAGAWSTRLLGNYSLGARINPVKGQIILFRSRPGELDHIVFGHGRYAVPRRDGLILVGSTLENCGFDKTCTKQAQEDLLGFAQEAIPDLFDRVSMVRQWAGLRPGSEGNVPTVSRHPELQNLFINSGHHRYGVTMAPASAELIEALLLDKPTHIDKQPYEWRK